MVYAEAGHCCFRRMIALRVCGIKRIPVLLCYNRIGEAGCHGLLSNGGTAENQIVLRRRLGGVCGRHAKGGTQRKVRRPLTCTMISLQGVSSLELWGAGSRVI